MHKYRSIGVAGVMAGVLIFAVQALPQNPEDTVLAGGKPPLTQLMVGKVIVLMDWVLGLEVDRARELEIRRVIVDSWRRGDRGDIDGALAVIDAYERVFRMNEAQRTTERSRLREIFLKSLRADRADELAALLLRAYDSAQKGRPVSSPADNSAASPRRNGKRVGSDELTGIWRMVRPRPININSTGSEPGYWIEYITFLPDGNVYWRLPAEGLLNFDSEVARRAYPNDWGTYTVEDEAIKILRGPERKPYLITRAGDRLNNPPSLGKGTFRRIPPADGLRIEGNYRRNDQEPSLSFSRDGRFQDGGVFRYFGSSQRPDGTIYNDSGHGGSGTYLIDQNTLELRYSDGRVRRVPFIAFPENLAKNPALDSFILRHEEAMRRH